VTFFKKGISDYFARENIMINREKKDD